MNPILAIVVPCYKEEPMLPITVAELTKVIDNLINSGYIDEKSFMLFVNDGSTDQTWPLIANYCKMNKKVCGVNLAGNVGHQNALMAGLTVAKDYADILVSIDADLQDDTSVIKDMVDKFKKL